jgi:peptidoglycan-associated lipoprotein
MHKKILILVATAVFAVSSGCASNKPKPTTSAPTGNGNADQLATSGANNADALGNSEAVNNGGGEEAPGPSEGQLKNRTIYFDFDSSEIRTEYNEMITAHARYLAGNPAKRVRVEGNTDERGSREYNIGLGERRAQAVRRALMVQGVSESQITTVSYGEERPAVTGHTDESWSRNRRANIAYLN